MVLLLSARGSPTRSGRVDEDCLRRDVRIRIPPPVRRAMEVLITEGYEAFAVGGAVRDSLLGLEPADWDIATNATPEETVRVFESHGYRAVPTGAEYGTVTVVDPERNEYEVTTYRREVYLAARGRKPVVSWARSLRYDVVRRDFTVNALAATIEGYIVDCVGGLRDLEQGVVRFIGDPYERIAEDPLRMLRLARFVAKLGFRADERSLEAVRRMHDYLRYISRERVGEEFYKAAKTPRFTVFVHMLRLTDLYRVVLPELDEMDSVRHDYRYKHYGETVYQHTLDVLSRCDGVGAPPLVKIAALLHDIAKPYTVTVEEGMVRFPEHWVYGSEHARRIVLERLRYSSAAADRVARLVRWHHLAYSYPEHFDAQEVAHRILARLREDAPDLLLLNYCDSGDPKYLEASRIAREELSRKAVKPLVSGREVMELYGLGPGKLVGIVKELLFTVQVSRGIEDRDALLETVCRETGLCPGAAQHALEVLKRLVEERYGARYRPRAVDLEWLYRELRFRHGTV